MGENLLRNIRKFGTDLLKYSWAIGLFVFIFGVIINQSFIAPLLLGLLFWGKWALIGFLTREFCDLFLVNPEEENDVK